MFCFAAGSELYMFRSDPRIYACITVTNEVENIHHHKMAMIDPTGINTKSYQYRLWPV